MTFKEGTPPPNHPFDKETGKTESMIEDAISEQEWPTLLEEEYTDPLQIEIDPFATTSAEFCNPPTEE